MMDPIKLKTKNQKNRPLLVEPDDHVTIGNKPKSKIYSKGPKLLTKQNQVVLINLKPKIPANPDQPLEILRTVHSFDPCIACAVHIIDTNGKELGVYKVDPIGGTSRA